MASSRSNNGGCGCVILLVLAIVFAVYKCNESDLSSKTKGKSEVYSNVEKHSNYSEYLTGEELSEEDLKWVNNSLSTGATPYKDVYGKNYRCPYNQCSGIRVTAPSESDIVVIIKRENQNGKVVAHGYIKAGGSFLFDIPDGTCQTFFYYGEGWNPNKEMGNGVKGGFIENEIFSKDNPQEIYSGILTYVLQLQRDGNFQTRSSSRDEVF